MQIFLEQFYIGLAWFSAFASGIFTIWFFTDAWEKSRARARRITFFKPAPGDNPVHKFVCDWCDRIPKARIYASDLYDAYRLWCQDNDIEVAGRAAFGRHLSEMKLEREVGRYSVYLDLELNSKAHRRIALDKKTCR